MTLGDVLGTLAALAFIIFIIFFPLAVGILLFLWLDPTGFWQSLAALIFCTIVIGLLYFAELFIAAVS